MANKPTNAANFIDLEGKRFTRLEVVAYAGKGRWVCFCVCGKVKSIAGSSLRGGTTQSCGCLQREAARRTSLRHGQRHSCLYGIWTDIKSRCLNPKVRAYHNYGGRGIKMHAAWVSSFERFARDVGKRPSPTHTLDRRDNNGHYEPGNVRWATAVEQNNNRRGNRLLTLKGVTRTYAEWCRISGVNYKTFHTRLSRGKTPTEALEL